MFWELFVLSGWEGISCENTDSAISLKGQTFSSTEFHIYVVTLRQIILYGGEN